MSQISKVDDDLYAAICRSIGAVELTGNADVDLEALVVAARDSLYVLSSELHTKANAHGLLVRLSDKRVLATTHDAESADVGDTIEDASDVDDAAVRSATVAKLNGERLVVRAPRSLEFLSALEDSGDAEHWFEDG